MAGDGEDDDAAGGGGGQYGATGVRGGGGEDLTTTTSPVKGTRRRWPPRIDCREKRGYWQVEGWHDG